MDVLKKVPVREQDAKVRAANFDEVCLGYNMEEAMEEASRCINCKNAQCIKGCPVAIDIPGFIEKVKGGDIEAAYQVISQSSALPAVCGRVCPQESQCEGKCIRGIKGEPVSIGKLERFTADWAREKGIVPKGADEKLGKKVAVIGSGPAGLTCAGDLARLGYDVTIFEALHEAGGVLVYGIPEFRLPKEEVVQKEIENVKSLGVKIETDVVVGKAVTIDELMEEEGFDAYCLPLTAASPALPRSYTAADASSHCLNPIMVDGTGMCGACRVLVGGEVKFACVDGPEFDGHLVDFDNAMKRQQQYKTEEGRAMLRLEEGNTHHGGCGQCS